MQHIADDLTKPRWQVLMTAAQSRRGVVAIVTTRDGVENPQAIAACGEAQWLARAGLLVAEPAPTADGVETYAWRLTVLGEQVSYLHDGEALEEVDG